MADSVATTALKAVAARLAAWPALAGVTVERERIAPVEDVPAIVISVEGTARADVFTGRTDLTIGVKVECFHLGTAGDTEAEVRDAAETIASEAARAIASDITLGGAADDAEVGEIAVELLGGDPVAARADVSLTVTTGHLRNDPFTRA